MNKTQLGYRLLLALQREQEELARADLHEALSVKDPGNPVLLNQIACSERDPLLRTMAASAVARSLIGRNFQDTLIANFNRQWVPEL